MTQLEMLFDLAGLDLDSVRQAGMVRGIAYDATPARAGQWYTPAMTFDKPSGPIAYLDIWAIKPYGPTSDKSKPNPRAEFVLKRKDGSVVCDSLNDPAKANVPLGNSYFAFSIPLSAEQYDTLVALPPEKITHEA